MKRIPMLQRKTVILCVDDEENPLMLRKAVLENAGYAVITASSAGQALVVVSSRRIDLVLTDYLMPGASGTELARRIKAGWPSLPVILYSGVNETRRCRLCRSFRQQGGRSGQPCVKGSQPCWVGRGAKRREKPRPR